MLQLLDVIGPRFIDTAKVLPKPVLPDSLPADTTHSAAVNVSGNVQQLADIAPIFPNSNGLEVSPLWTILVVIIALSICFYFVKKYRKLN